MHDYEASYSTENKMVEYEVILDNFPQILRFGDVRLSTGN